jgi:hypothetical protein
MNDEKFEQKEVPLVVNPFTEADLADLEKEEKPAPVIVEPRKPNRHERRKRAKLARMLEAKEKAEVERQKGK